MPKVRFAPSPSGSLHIGSARTAIVNYLFAKSQGGSFVLRIEDTDTTRTSQQSKDSILSALDWLGVTWDEGPFYQSQRLPLYKQYRDLLLASGKAYPCFCSQEELSIRKEKQIELGRYPSYDGRCEKLSGSDVQKKIENKDPFIIRLKNPNHPIVFNDLIKGDLSFDGDIASDLVLVRTDGTPTYNFAVVVDDHLMGITHVIRGEDHLSNTPKQIAIYNAMQWEKPIFGHIPLILGPDKTKLSKRHCDTAIEDYRDKGFLKEAIFCYLALLGYSRNPTKEIFDQKTLLSKFKLDQLSNSPSQFDIASLIWMNGQFIKDNDPDILFKDSQKWLQSIPIEEEKKKKIFLLSRNQIKTLGDLPSLYDPFLHFNLQKDNPQIQKTIQEVDFWPSLGEYFTRIEQLPVYDVTGLETLFTEIVTKNLLNKRNFAQMIRIIVTGGLISPALFDTLVLLGKDEVLDRWSQFLGETNHDKKN